MKFYNKKGYISFEENNNIIDLDLIYIEPIHRWKGEGKKLLNEFLKTIKKKEIKKISLFACPQFDSPLNLEELKEFYEDFWFEVKDKVDIGYFMELNL